jgi:hypothetical protein
LDKSYTTYRTYWCCSAAGSTLDYEDDCTRRTVNRELRQLTAQLTSKPRFH